MTDVIGTWVNSDGASLTLDSTGQFTAHSLSNAIFWRKDQQGTMDGSGRWILRKGRSYWEVRLFFTEISGNLASREIPVLVPDIGNVTYLYQWKGEEGEGLYKLFKQSPPTQKQELQTSIRE